MLSYRVNGNSYFVFCAAIILSLLMLRGSAWGHAIVIDSVPKDGSILSVSLEVLSLRFNARIEKSLTRARLVRKDGVSIPVTIVSKGSRAAEEPDRLVIRFSRLDPGVYTLKYTVLATDGHATPGILRFTVVKGP